MQLRGQEEVVATSVGSSYPNTADEADHDNMAHMIKKTKQNGIRSSQLVLEERLEIGRTHVFLEIPPRRIPTLQRVALTLLMLKRGTNPLRLYDSSTSFKNMLI